VLRKYARQAVTRCQGVFYTVNVLCVHSTQYSDVRGSGKACKCKVDAGINLKQ
jgi:hypothetical protein